MAGASRRGYGEDGIYFDHRADCRDSAHHKTCSGRWRGVVSLGFDADGKRVRRKVSGQTRTEVKDKLKAVHAELDAGVRSAAGYTVEKAVADWLDEGLPGAHGQDDRGEPGLAAAAAGCHWGDPTQRPDRAGRAGGAEEDVGYSRDPDAAEGTQLPDAGAAARGAAGPGAPERVDAGGYSRRARRAPVAVADALRVVWEGGHTPRYGLLSLEVQRVPVRPVRVSVADLFLVLAMRIGGAAQRPGQVLRRLICH
jgi:hypothetical protein